MSSINETNTAFRNEHIVIVEPHNIDSAYNKLKSANEIIKEAEKYIQEAHSYSNSWKGKTKETYTKGYSFLLQSQNKFTSITDEIENAIKVLGKEVNDLKSATAAQQFTNVKEG